MRMEIRGRTALITGAGAGIGKAVAVHLAELGVNLLLCGRGREKLEKTKELCEEKGVYVELFVVDVRREEQIRQMFGGISQVDYVINNAGVVISAPFEETTTEMMDLAYETNIRGAFLVSKYALPFLRESECPTIINMGSVVSVQGYVDQCAYAASKHALMGMTKVMAKELAPENIRVHILCPGGIMTDMLKEVRPELADGPVILPEDIGDIMEFLLTHRTNAVIDEIHVHRSSKAPF